MDPKLSCSILNYITLFSSDQLSFRHPQDPGVGRAALQKNRGLRDEYTLCVQKHMTDKQRELYRAPVSYTSQIGAPPKE
jgi:hypothetical protein